MKRIFEIQHILPVCVFFMLGIVYLYILNVHAELSASWVYWMFSFFLTLLFYYLIFLISTVLQIISIKIFKLFPLKVYSLYPFTYDGQLRFHPIRLLYNTEGFQNSLLLHLVQFRKDEDILMEKMKSLCRIRKVCTFLAVGCLFLCWNTIDIKTVSVCFIVYLLLISLSYFRYGTFWYGYDYLYRKGPRVLTAYLYAAKSIMFLDSEDYAEALSETEDEFFTLSILENYLYCCIREKSMHIAVELLRSAVSKTEGEDQFFQYDLRLDTKRLNIIKLIGWTGIYYENEDVRQLSFFLYTKLYDFMLENGFSDFYQHGLQGMKKEIQYLKTARKEDACELQLQDMQNIFSTYEDMFKAAY